jgi:arginine decarboxylase
MIFSPQIIPKHFFFTSGVGFDNDEITSFEFALRSAKCETFNFVPVSSILPPKCKEVTRDMGLKNLKTGEIVFCVMSRISTEKKGTPITVAVANATHIDKKYGYFIENKEMDGDFLQNTAKAKKIAFNLLDTIRLQNPALAENEKSQSRESKKFDFGANIPIEVIDEGNKIYASSGKQLLNDYTIKWSTLSATNSRKEKWMTLLALAVFTLK